MQAFQRKRYRSISCAVPAKLLGPGCISWTRPAWLPRNRFMSFCRISAGMIACFWSAIRGSTRPWKPGVSSMSCNKREC